MTSKTYLSAKPERVPYDGRRDGIRMQSVVGHNAATVFPSYAELRAMREAIKGDMSSTYILLHGEVIYTSVLISCYTHEHGVLRIVSWDPLIDAFREATINHYDHAQEITKHTPIPGESTRRV